MAQTININTCETVKDAELLAPNEKCLVLGSSGYCGVDAVEWDEEVLPNIVDYDVIIVDVRALDENKLSIVSSKRLEAIRFQLTRLLHSHGRISSL